MPGHCARCEVYESKVMALGPGGELPEFIVPCPDYAMSAAFRDHLVAQMQKEMAGSIQSAGLDRLAILKGKKS